MGRMLKINAEVTPNINSRRKALPPHPLDTGRLSKGDQMRDAGRHWRRWRPKPAPLGAPNIKHQPK